MKQPFKKVWKLSRKYDFSTKNDKDKAFRSVRNAFLLSLQPMKYTLYILMLLMISTHLFAQTRRGGRSGFSLSNLSGSNTKLPDSLLVVDSAELKSKKIIAYQLTPLLGDAYIAPMDTSIYNTSNRTLTEGKGLAIGYLANLGSPAQTRIFSERKEARDFIFADAFDYYITTPENAKFYDAKTPFTNVMYTTAGGSVSKEEQLTGTIGINFGKKINIGGDFDYIYGRGFYSSNGNKLISYRIFGSYRSDRYEFNAYASNYNFVLHENGGLADDNVLTHPEDYSEGRRNMVSTDYPVLYTNVFNRVKGKQYFLTHRYNLGFTRTLEETDKDGYAKEVFIPVSSIIHTFQYEDNQRRFTTSESSSVATDTLFNQGLPFNYDDKLNDVMSYWSMKNIIALSLREGFQNWVKFGLTAFIDIEKRRYRMQDGKRDASTEIVIPDPDYSFIPPTFQSSTIRTYDELSTYVGAELSKRTGKLFTYNARGELCILGDDVGEFRASGELRTTFNLFQKEAYVKANAYIKNMTPAFFQRHYHSRYFWWDNDFNMIQQFYVGGEVNVESTQTKLSAGVESIQNYVYFGKDGMPVQHENNLQVVTARLKQNFYYRALGWENELAYQISSNQNVLPLPDLSVYSNLYLKFKLAKVLNIQIGADLHYNTAYYAPYYEAATQQFQVQDEVKVGNYPLINAYANFNLKQARFFVMVYNLSSQFVRPNYFSLAHYPLNPMMIKMGVAVRFNN